MSDVIIRNTFIDVPVVSAVPTSRRRSSSLPADLRASKGEKYERLQFEDSDVATDAGTEDVLQSDSSYTGAESEADVGTVPGDQQPAVWKMPVTPLSSKARPWKPLASQSWDADAYQYTPWQQVQDATFVSFDTLPIEFAQDAATIVSYMVRTLEMKTGVYNVDVQSLAQGGWEMHVFVAGPCRAKELLNQAMISLLQGAEMSACTYVLGWKALPLCTSSGPLYMSEDGLSFTAQFAAMREEANACRAMYDMGYCQDFAILGSCRCAHPPCTLPFSLTVVLDEETASADREAVEEEEQAARVQAEEGVEAEEEREEGADEVH